MSDNLIGKEPDLVLDSRGCHRPPGWRLWIMPLDELPQGVATFELVLVAGVELALVYSPIKEESDEERMVAAARVVA